jgi:hypothetical protein
LALVGAEVDFIFLVTHAYHYKLDAVLHRFSILSF